MLAQPGRRELLADVALALLVCWTATSVYLSHYGVDNALSSDNVMPYVMFDDVFHRGIGLGGFLLPESPFYFPDTALAWLVYALTGGLLPAVTAYAWISSTIFVLLMRALLFRAQIGADLRARAAWLVMLGLWLAICLLGVRTGLGWFGQFHAGIFFPCNHSGALLGLLAGFAIVFGDKAKAGAGSIAALTLLCVCLLLSDRLFEVQFILPALGYCGYRYRASRQRWHLHAAIVLLALLVGAELLRWLFPSDTMRWVAALANADADFQIGGDPTMRIAAAAALARMTAGFAQIAAADPATTLIELAALTCATWLPIAALLRNSADKELRNRAILATVVLVAVLAPLVASVVLGRHIALHAFRYCQTTIMLLLPLSLLVADRFGRSAASVRAASVFGAIAALLIPTIIDASRSALYAHEHDQETCLRELATTRRMKFGVAEFWHALEMTAHFPSTPVTAPLGVDAGPRMSMVTNIGWFGALAARPDAMPSLDFVDEYSYAPELLDQVFGAPAQRVKCPRSTYRLYAAADGALAHMYRHFQWMPGQIMQRLGRVTLPAAAWAADGAYVEGDSIHANGPLAPATPLLIAAQDFPPGRLHVWLAYSLAAGGPGAGARWDASSLDGNGNAVATLGRGSLAESTSVTQVDLPLDSRPEQTPGLGISVTASGQVDLHIIAIGLRIDQGD